MKKILTILFVLGAHFLYAQNADTKKHDFENGDAICSTNGKVLGGNWFLANKESLDKFIGIYNKPSSTSNQLMSDIFQSKGMVYVNLKKGELVKKGDYLTLDENGKLVKLQGQGVYLGVALEDGQNDKVKILLTTGFKN